MKKGMISAVSMIVGAVAGAGAIGKMEGDRRNKAQSMSDKHLALFLMMNQWVKMKQQGRNLSEYFERNGYKRIAVYGMSYAGETFIDELKGSKAEIVYGIDQRANSIYADVDIFSVDDALKEVDVVVVTAITFFDEIEEKLSRKLDCPIISLEDVLYEI